MELRVRRDEPRVVVAARSDAEVAAEPLEAALDGVDVRVDEPGMQHPARQIDHLGGRAAPCAQVNIHRRDATVDDGDLQRFGHSCSQGIRPGNTTAARPPVDDSSDEE